MLTRILRPLTLSAYLLLGLLAGCSDQSESFNDQLDRELAEANPKQFLYVASGSCYAGGVATSTGAFTVAAYDLETGNLDRLVIDYNRIAPGDAPIAIQEFDAQNLLVLVENAAGRRIDLVRKDGQSISTYLVNATALSAAMRRMVRLPDSSLLISKSTAIEKISSARSRVTQGANPYVNAPAGACATTATLISGVTTLSNGKIVYTHAAASPNNKIVMVSATGYAAAPDCLTAVAAPVTTALPTDLIRHSSGQLLVSYGSTTATSNFLYAFDANATTNIINNASAAFNDNSIVNGPSAMTEDPLTGDIFVANGNAAFNNIERFSFNPNTRLLTRIGTQPFVSAQLYSRCISDIKVISE